MVMTNYDQYPYLCTIYDINYYKWCEINDWCHDKNMDYVSDFISATSVWLRFKNANDATLFKLIWSE